MADPDRRPDADPTPSDAIGGASTVLFVEQTLHAAQTELYDPADPGSDDQVAAPTVVEPPTDRGARRTAPPAPAEAGGRYERRARLGAGGMGVVDLIWDRDLMRELAVKRLRAGIRDDPAITRLFLREARVTAALEHPNVVPVHDLGLTPKGEPFFTMKRVEGDSLREVIDALREGDGATVARYPLPRRLRLLLGVCRALSTAHGHGVIHRDLKPANVMLGPRGEVVVMDWGLAHPLERCRQTPLAELFDSFAPPRGVSGTPAYMSPEQARAEPLDERSDIYALGVILYELVSLRRPYDATTAHDLMRHVIEARVVSIREAVPGIAPPLAAVIEKAMAAGAADRYGSVDALAEDVERVLDGLTPLAENASTLRAAGRWYMHRDPRFANLRVADVDLMAFGAGLIGAAVGYWVSGLVAGWTAWAALAAGVGLCVPFMVKWLGSPRRAG